ncbi:MAG: hypothetical protein EPO61_01380 [Nitrospirae bacterium]|nr:MAG: hypothetical protein EPO61_01380 [Nitrospirota bacterium]
MNSCTHRPSKPLRLTAFLMILLCLGPSGLSPAGATDPAQPPAGGEEGLQIEVTKKGLGKEVTIRKGSKEWYMLVEVTPENTVVVRQEKDGDKYLVDESETHDRSLTKEEVDGAIADYVNSVKIQVKKRK